jgi:hypothetical protein
MGCEYGFHGVVRFCRILKSDRLQYLHIYTFQLYGRLLIEIKNDNAISINIHQLT